MVYLLIGVVVVLTLVVVLRSPHEKSQHYSNSAQVLGVALGAVALIHTLWSKSENDTSTKLLEKQIQVLQATNEKMTTVEILPLLIVEPLADRFKIGLNHIEDVEQFKKNPMTPVKQPSGAIRPPFVPDTDDFLRIRNVGRGPAFQVMVMTFPEKLIINDKVIPAKRKESACVAFKMIPAGESVRFDHFEGELRVTKEPQRLVGHFGLYCTDGDAHEIAWLLEFHYTTYLNEDEPYATLEVESPRHYVRTEAKPGNKRSVDDLIQHFRNTLDEEAAERAKPKPAT